MVNNVDNVPENKLFTIDTDYAPDKTSIDDGGLDIWDDGNYIKIPASSDYHVRYLENCEKGTVNGE